MYTAVLMLTLVAGSESIEHGRGGGCCGYSGYSGYSCSGGAYYRGGSCCGGHYAGGYYGCSGYYAGGMYRAAGPVYSGGVIVASQPVQRPATIVVTLPADARLTFNGAPTQSSGENRTFVTPALEPGASYAYTLRMEVPGGAGEQAIVQTREVIIRPGETSAVRFDLGSQQRVTGSSR